MSGNLDLMGALEEMLSRLKMDQFGGRDAPVVSLAADTGIDGNGVLQGALEVHIPRKNGELALIHTEQLRDISDEAALRDALSDALSKVLSIHDTWPR